MKQAAQQAEQQARQAQGRPQQQSAPSAPTQPAANARNSPSPDGASPAAPGQSGPIVPAPAWVPPNDTDSGTGAGTAVDTPNNSAAAAAPVKLDPAKLPDVVGLRLGMSEADATVAVHKAYSVNIIEHFPFGSWPDRSNPNMGFTVLDAHNQSVVDMSLSFTAPPGPQVLWRAYRSIRGLNINHQVFLNDLRAKYGKESYATDNYGHVAKNDPQIITLFWLYKEDGEQIPLSALTPFQVQSVAQCWGAHVHLPPIMPYDKGFATEYPGFCSGIVVLQIDIGPNTIAYGAEIKMEDIPLAIRTANAANAYLANVAAQQRKKELEKSKQVKPVL